ncbi:MAG: hypothetical protein ABH864_06390 [archaeon]
MRKKGLLLLGILVIVVVGLFFFSSWTNAMVVSGEGGAPQGIGILANVSPLLAGLLTVVTMAVLIAVIFDR